MNVCPDLKLKGGWAHAGPSAVTLALSQFQVGVHLGRQLRPLLLRGLHGKKLAQLYSLLFGSQLR